MQLDRELSSMDTSSVKMRGLLLLVLIALVSAETCTNRICKHELESGIVYKTTFVNGICTCKMVSFEDIAIAVVNIKDIEKRLVVLEFRESNAEKQRRVSLSCRRNDKKCWPVSSRVWDFVDGS